jgi:plastocyanin
VESIYIKSYIVKNMGSVSFLIPIIVMLLVLVYLSPLGFHDTNTFGSVSEDDDDSAVEQPGQQSLPSTDTSGGIATRIYDTHEFNVGDGVQNLFILIPNEAHHGPGEEDEARYLNQPFVPESVTISPGTNVVWFNGDVGHEHNIAISGGSSSGAPNPLYQTGEFSEFDARNYTFDDVGDFSYADTVEYENGFIMRGSVSITDSSQQGTSGDSQQTVGLLMVPTENLAQYTQDLQSRGFVIDSTHNFPDLREGDEQTLVVWEAPESTDTSTILANLAEVSQQFPYS